MATLATVARLALALPETVEAPSQGGLRQWRVKGKLLAWERPLRPADIRALGPDAPTGTILAVYVPDLETKEAMIATRSDIYFTTPHFDGYAMVLLRLATIGAPELTELLREAWRCRAPKSVQTRSKGERAGQAPPRGATVDAPRGKSVRRRR